MAKFTILFKGKAIQSAYFDSGIIHIGSDNTNDLIIDSLAVAPAHAVVNLNEDPALIKQLNTNFPLIINNEASKECAINNNDEIAIGKHKIIYYTTESVVSPAQQPKTPTSKDVESLNEELEGELSNSDANLQVMAGKHIGRLIPLKKSMTRIGHSGNGLVVIARRKDGYYISCLENSDSLTVNDKLLQEQTIKLSDNDQVVIDDTPMQFFLD